MQPVCLLWLLIVFWEKGSFLISPGSLSLIQTLTGNVRSSSGEERWRQTVSTLKDTRGWMNKELGGPWLFNRARKSLRKARAGQHRPLNPFSRLAPKSLSVLLYCLLDLRPFLILSYECLFLLDFIGTCNIYVVVTFQRSLRD